MGDLGFMFCTVACFSFDGQAEFGEVQRRSAESVFSFWTLDQAPETQTPLQWGQIFTFALLSSSFLWTTCYSLYIPPLCVRQSNMSSVLSCFYICYCTRSMSLGYRQGLWFRLSTDTKSKVGQGCPSLRDHVSSAQHKWVITETSWQDLSSSFIYIAWCLYWGR